MNTYETHMSHYHCWQEDDPPCGLPGRHRCCICGLEVPEDKVEFIAKHLEAQGWEIKKEEDV